MSAHGSAATPGAPERTSWTGRGVTERAQQRPDRLLAAVERIIEDHLPTGSPEGGVRSMAQAIVRHVRITEPAGGTAALPAILHDPPGASCPGGPVPRTATAPTREGVTGDDFETADITVMRERGSLPAFMRSRIARSRRTTYTAPRSWPPAAASGHRPGAWPSVTAPSSLSAAPRPLWCSCELCCALAQHAETDSCRCAICVHRLLAAAA